MAQVLELSGPQGTKLQIEMQARLVCADFPVLLESAKRGMGIATLPDVSCAAAVASGELEVVLPGWAMPQGTVHFVYPTRRGLLPGVRALVEFLAERLAVA